MLIFGIYTRCQWMKVKVRCSKFECREDVHFKTQPGPVAKNARVQFPAGGLGVAFFATGPGWVLKCISSRHSNLLHLTLTFIYIFIILQLSNFVTIPSE